MFSRQPDQKAALTAPARQRCGQRDSLVGRAVDTRSAAALEILRSRP